MSLFIIAALQVSAAVRLISVINIFVDRLARKPHLVLQWPLVSFVVLVVVATVPRLAASLLALRSLEWSLVERVKGGGGGSRSFNNTSTGALSAGQSILILFSAL